MKSSLKLVALNTFTHFPIENSLALNTFTLHFPIENVLQSTWLSGSTWIFLVFELMAVFELFIWPAFDFPDRLEFLVFELMAIFELFVRPAFDFPDRLEFFCYRTRNCFRTRGHLWTVRSTSLRLSGSTWIFFFFELFEGFNLHFDRQFSSDTKPFKPFTCTLALSIHGARLKRFQPLSNRLHH